MKYNISILFLWMAFQGLVAQNAPLSAEEAVSIALENNYNIKITRSDIEIAALNNTRANAGMLPTVNLVVNETANVNAFQELRLADGRTIGAVGAFNNNANAAVQLNWTLFDGKRMYIVKDRFSQQELLAQHQLKVAVQNTTAAVLETYYGVVGSQLQERAIQEVIALNEERLRIAEARLAAGFAAQTDALQAKIDLNQRKGDLISQQNMTATNRRNLNLLMARVPDTPMTLPTAITSTYKPDRAALIQQLESNPAMLSLLTAVDIAQLNVAETKTLWKPRINGIGQANLVRTDNAANFILNNTQIGVSAGVQLVMPLYTGGNLRRQQDIATVAVRQAEMRINDQKMILESALANQIAFFETQSQILALEDENIRIARENLMVSTERFRVGTTNGLEPQIAQNSLEQALARKNQVLFNLKSAEIRLKLAAGAL